MQITTVKITYGRTVQPAQYESKRGEAEVTVAFEEGEKTEGKVEQVIQFVQAKVHEMVGLKKPDPSTKAEINVLQVSGTPSAADAPTGTKEAAAAKMNAADNVKRPGRPPKAAKPAETKPAEEKPQISTTPEDRVGPEDVDTGIDMTDPTEVPAADVTDKQLTEAVTMCADKTKKLPDIRKLIIKFVGKTPCKVIDIPAAARSQFLEELGQITA